MNSTVQVEWNDDVKEESQVHKLPCNIEYNGTARVADLFCVANDGTSSFRGHKLVSVNNTVPDAYTGVVLDIPERTTDTEEQLINVTHTFSEYKSWGWDIKPQGANEEKLIAIQKALHHPL